MSADRDKAIAKTAFEAGWNAGWKAAGDVRMAHDYGDLDKRLTNDWQAAETTVLDGLPAEEDTQ